MTIPTSLTLAQEMISKLREQGRQTFIVGGWPRALIMGKPCQELDLVTEASPNEVLSLFPKSRLVGRVFPVVLAKLEGRQVEIASLRSQAQKGMDAFKADVLQRDFTINSLLYDPLNNELIDFSDGQKDIERLCLRFNPTPLARIQEDPLRLLRAVRLAGTLGLEIEQQSLLAIRQQAGLIQTVASERVLAELDKCWASPGRAQCLRLLDHTGLLDIVLPEVAALKGLAQPADHHPEGDGWTHTCLVLRYLPTTASRALVWAAVLHDIGKAATQGKDHPLTFPDHEQAGAVMAQCLLTRLRADRHLIDQVSGMITRHGQWNRWQDMRTAAFIRWLAEPAFAEESALYYADKMAGDQQLIHYLQILEKARQYPEPAQLVARAFGLINGHDLARLGLEPGPAYRSLLGTLHDAILEERLTNREQALAMAKDLITQWQSSRQS